MVQFHLSRKITVVKAGHCEVSGLSVLELTMDDQGCIRSYSINPYEKEIANCLYHDKPLTLDLTVNPPLLKES